MIIRMNATIVIPNYNGKAYLASCLQSIYEGTTVPKVIVADNGSSDGSLALIEENYPQVQIIRFPDNQGFCTAVNAGIRATDTKYVILLNNDTRAEAHFVEELVKSIEKKPNAFSVSAKMLSMKEPDIIDDAGDLYCALGWAFALGKGKVKEYCDKEREIFAACGGASIYRRDLFERIGYFDENHFAYLEDMDIGYRAKIFGYRNYFTPKAIVYHAGSAVSGSRYNEFKVKLSSRNSIYLVFKNMPLLQLLVNLPFLLPGFLIKFLFFVKKGLGKTYFLGLLRGIGLSFSQEGKQNKVKFQMENINNYMRIQLELWINMAFLSL